MYATIVSFTGSPFILERFENTGEKDIRDVQCSTWYLAKSGLQERLIEEDVRNNHFVEKSKFLSWSRAVHVRDIFLDIMLRSSRRCLQALNETSKPSHVGRKLVKGVVIGGLAGAIAGLAVELSPEEYGLKQKTKEWFEYGKSMIGVSHAPMGALPEAPAERVHREAPPSSQQKPEEEKQPVEKTQEPVVVTQITPVPETIPVPVEEDQEEEEEEEEKEEIIETRPAEEIQESIPEVGEPSRSDEAEVEPAKEEEESDEKAVITEKLIEEEQLVEKLKGEVENLRDELTRLQRQHDSDMASAAGSTQATLDTLDRLLNERETAVSVARHGILVNELLYSMALDQSNISAGALKVDFNRRMDGFIRDCFSPPEKSEISFFKLLLARLLASLYSVSDGDSLRRMKIRDSRTWENLCTVQVARAAVDKGDFSLAVIHMELLKESESAQEWVMRVKQAQQLWQGAHAAVASLHDDLSKVY